MTIKNVEVSIIDRAWGSGYVRPQPPEWLSGKTVAVIGSGPAGLAAAQQLTRAGHTVAVYERADKIGGLLRYGIPEFKMEKKHLDRRLDQMRREGTVFRAGVDVGGDLTGPQLLARYDAVVLAMGATDARDLPVTGRELGGIHQAMEFLPAVQPRVAGRGDADGSDQILATDKDVVIIGGGDTGADCLGTSIRQGARSITQLEIMPQPGEDRPAGQPWPTYPMTFRVSSAHEEGGDRVYAVSTQEFVGDDDGNVARCGSSRSTRSSSPSRAPSARSRPQLVLLAMGFVGPEKRGPHRAARGRARRARQRPARRVVRRLRAGRLRRRRRRSRPVADRVGDRRGPQRGRLGRRLPHRLDDPARADQAARAPAGRLSAVRCTAGRSRPAHAADSWASLAWNDPTSARLGPCVEQRSSAPWAPR